MVSSLLETSLLILSYGDAKYAVNLKGIRSQMAARLVSLDFEVFGRVQGVSFRAYTRRQALKLGIVGWVQNTIRDTVIGNIQGEESRVVTMKDWLQTTGSPASKIDKVVFTDEHQIEKLVHSTFDIKK